MQLSPRLRFKLERLKSKLRSAFSKAESYETGHRMCPHCRALIDQGTSVCPFCGGRTRAPRSRPSGAPGRVVGGLIPIPSTGTSVLVAVNVGLYALSWYLSQSLNSVQLGGGGMSGDIRGDVLLRLGGKFGPYIFAGQWWRLVTAMFLHGGLLHIGMNLWCLFDLGPTVESLFSTPKFLVFYLTSGVAGFLLSLWWKPFILSVGASGGILGLIGVLIGASFHHGSLGRALRGQLLRWVIYILIFGLLPFFAVDNAAHIGGLGMGLLLGYVVPEGEPVARADETLWNALALLSVVIIAGSFALMALHLNHTLR